MEQHHSHSDQTTKRPCDSIRATIRDLFDEIEADQEALKNATPQEKARLANDIEQLQARLPGLRRALVDCILRLEKKDAATVMVTAEPLLQRIDHMLMPA